MPWWMTEKEDKESKDKKEKKDKEEEFELKPKEVKEKLDAIDGLKSSVEELKGKSSILDRMATFLDNVDAAKKEQNKQQRQQQLQQQQEDQEEELSTEFITDPVNATKKLLRQTTAPLVEANVNMQAKLTMKELMDSHPEEYEYATDPKVRLETEALIGKLPLSSRTDPESIKNCYLVVEGRHKQEIKEGKIKSRLAATSSAGNGTGSPKAESEEGKISLTDNQKKAAKIFGMTEEEYAKGAKELNYV